MDAVLFRMRKLFLFGGIVFLGCVFAASAFADVIDQQQPTENGSYQLATNLQWHQLAQTFTAAQDGTLNSIDLAIGLNSGSTNTGTLTIDFYNTFYGPASYGTGYSYGQIPGTPDLSSSSQFFGSATVSASSLSSVNLSYGQVAPFVTINLPTPFAVTAGSHYTMLLRVSGDNTFVWSGNLMTDTYTGGKGFARVDDGYAWSYVGYAGGPSGDFAFRTNVQPTPAPEPATIAMFGVGILGLAAKRRKHRN